MTASDKSRDELRDKVKAVIVGLYHGNRYNQKTDAIMTLIDAHTAAAVEEAQANMMFRERTHVIHEAQNRLYDLDRKRADKYFDGFDAHKSTEVSL